MRKQDFIITNMILVENFRNIIESDLNGYINQKNIFCFTQSNKVDISFTTSLDNSQYFDGFDIMFDKTIMK